jgi:hypothetical protein
MGDATKPAGARVRGSVRVPTGFRRALVEVTRRPDGGLLVRVDEEADAAGREANWIEIDVPPAGGPSDC